MLLLAAIYTGVTPGGGVRDPGGSWSIKAVETSTRFHSLSQEPYSEHLTIEKAYPPFPMLKYRDLIMLKISIGEIGFPYNKLQTSISSEPLGPQRPNLAWKYI